MSSLRGTDYALIFVSVAFIVYSLVLPANHALTMPDNVMTFDTWWYAHSRLKHDGMLPQWNPYSGLGRIAVQWNQVPVSIFSPILTFTELTPKLFEVLNFSAIIFSLIGIYLSARLFGYRSYLPLVGALLILPGFYNPHNHPLPFATFFLFFPAALAMVVRAMEEDNDNYLRWLLPAVLVLSLSFIGIRLENLVHALALLGLVVVCNFGTKRNLRRQKYLYRLVITSSLLMLPVAASAWQIAYLLGATLESGRALQPSKSSTFFNLDSWEWALVHLLRRPELLMVLVNVASLTALYCRIIQSLGTRERSHTVILSSRLRHRMTIAALLMPARQFFRNGAAGGQAAVAIIKQFSFVLCVSAGARLLFERSARAGTLFDGGDLSFSAWSLLSVALVAFALVAKGKLPPTIGIRATCIAFFSGMYVAEYSDNLGLFMRPIFCALIPLGAVAAVLAGRGWIVAALLLFHFFGEVGAIFLYDTLGVAWLSMRAAFVEVPLRIFLVLEGVLLLSSGIYARLSHVNARRKPSQHQVLAAVSASMLVLCFPGHATWLPLGGLEKISPDVIDAQVRAAHGRSLDARTLPDLERQQRHQVSGMHDFMPAYSQMLNTASVYATEVPILFKRMFSPSFQTAEPMPVRTHPEMGYVLRRHVLATRGPSTLHYAVDVAVPFDGNDALSLELLAARGSKTSRAFLSFNVSQFQDAAAEVAELRRRIAGGGTIADAITTSDPTFPLPISTHKVSRLPSSVRFIKDAPEHVVLEVDTPTDGYVALMDMWSSGWRAYVDDRQVPIYRGYVGGRIVAVPTGAHRVEFRYSVPGLRIATIISIGAWVLVVLLAGKMLVTAIVIYLHKPSEAKS